MSITVNNPSYDKIYKMQAWQDSNIHLVFTQGEGIATSSENESSASIEAGIAKEPMFQLRDKRGSIDLTGSTIQLALTRPDGSSDLLSCAIKNASDGIISCPITASATAIAGNAVGEIRVLSNNGIIKFYGVHFKIYEGVSDEAAEQSEQFSALQEALIKIEGLTPETYSKFFTPEMYGAVGDGEQSSPHDDKEAIELMINQVPDNALCVFSNNYYISDGITITKPVNIVMLGTVYINPTAEFGFRIQGHNVRRNKFRMNLELLSDVDKQWDEDFNEYKTIGVDLYGSWENEYDINIFGFNTGIRLCSSHLGDCTYNKVIIRSIMNCKNAILLTGDDSFYQDYYESQTVVTDKKINLKYSSTDGTIKKITINGVDYSGSDYYSVNDKTVTLASGIHVNVGETVTVYYNRVSGTTTAQNTFIGGRIGATSKMWEYLKINDVNDYYYPMQSIRVGSRTNNNNNFISVSFECGFSSYSTGTSEEQTAYNKACEGGYSGTISQWRENNNTLIQRSKVNANMYHSSFVGCRYEGVNDFYGHRYVNVFGGFAFENIAKSGSFMSFGNHSNIMGLSTEPVQIKKWDRGNGNIDLLKLSIYSNSVADPVVAKFDKSGTLAIPLLQLTPQATNGSASALHQNYQALTNIRIVKGASTSDALNSVDNSTWGFSRDSGYIVCKDKNGNKYTFLPLYSVEDTAHAPSNKETGMMVLIGNKPMWWNGSSWVYSNGTTTMADLVTTVTSSSTDNQYPTAKAVWDAIQAAIGGIENGSY